MCASSLACITTMIFALGAAVFAAAFGYGAIMPLLPELLTQGIVLEALAGLGSAH
mgnify:CR=1 FL=1